MSQNMLLFSRWWTILRVIWTAIVITLLLGLITNYVYAALFEDHWTWKPTPEALSFLRSRWPWFCVPLASLLLVTTVSAIARRRQVDDRLLKAATVRHVRHLRIGLRHGGGDVLIPHYQPNVHLMRAANSQISNALRQCGGVLIIGRPRSGKTRAAWEALRENPNALVVIPREDHPPTFNATGLQGKDVLLFFDDLHLTAQTAHPIAWWDRLSAATGHSVRLVCTSRDGADWEAVESKQPSLMQRLAPGCRIYMSRSGLQGADLSPEDGQKLASLLGLNLSDNEFDLRFDGTAGSLTLDLADMGVRYRRLRRERIDNVATSRILDSAKLLHQARQPRLKEPILRAVAERIRGNSPISSETWEDLRRRTEEEGFGVFAEGDFRTYRPYLERPECIEYEPSNEHIEKLIPILADHSDHEGIFYLGAAVAREDEALAERAYRVAGEAGFTRALNNLGNLLTYQPGKEVEAEHMLRRAIAAGDRGFPNTNLGILLQQQPGRILEAEQAYRDAIAAGDHSAHINLGNLLSRQAERISEAIDTYLEGIDIGIEPLYDNLGVLLSDRLGMTSDAERLYRIALANGVTRVNNNLGLLLAAQPGREAEAEQAYLDAVSAGDAKGHFNLALLLSRRPNRKPEAVQAFRDAIDNLRHLLAHQPRHGVFAGMSDREGIIDAIAKAYYGLGSLLIESPEGLSEGCKALLEAQRMGLSQANDLHTQYCPGPNDPSTN